MITDEKCLDYLNEPFLVINEKEGQNDFISKLINDLKKNIKNKKSFLTGTDIEILRILYTSSNTNILKHLNKSKIDNIYKDIFIEIINSKFERKLNEEYDYSIEEIFNNDNDETFDGNDDSIPRKLCCINKLVEEFLNKCELEK